jgi:hypothetical protein
MPRISRGPADDRIVVALDGFAGTAKDGSEYIVAKGRRFHAGDRVVREWPHLFVDEGSSDAEIAEARVALSGRSQ